MPRKEGYIPRLASETHLSQEVIDSAQMYYCPQHMGRQQCVRWKVERL